MFAYLEQTEIVKFQAVCKFMYNRGVERQQTRLHLYETPILYFTYPSTMFRNKLFAYDVARGLALEPILLPAEEHFNQWLNTRMVQCKESLFIFRHSSKALEVFRLENACSDSATMDSLPSLSRNAWMFAVANYRNELIFLTGGGTVNENR